MLRIEPTRQTGGQRTRRRTNRLRVDGSGILQRYDQSVRSGTFGRAGDGSEVTHVRHAVEEDDQRGFVFGHPFQNVVQFDVADGGDLGDDALVVAARQTVELLDRNLLIMQTVAHAKIFQLLHQLPFGAFADVEFFDLFARFDRFDYGADAEYKVFRHGIGRFVS